MVKLITQAKFARKIKLTPGRISQLVKERVILLVSGRVDPIQAEKAIRDKVDRSRQLDLELKSKSQKVSSSTKTDQIDQKDSNNLSLTDVRRNHELLKAELTSLRLQIKRGELVPKGEQIKWLIALGSATKLAFQGLPKRLAPVVRLYDDEKKIEVIIRDEIYKIIRELGKPLSAIKSRNPNKTDSR
jgi:hypothetical protein